jgi:hypothetical protein
MTWYVRKGDREIGPLSEQALRAIAATGQIDPQTLVRRSAMEEWVTVATVPGILPPASRAIPPPVAQPDPSPSLVPAAAPPPPPALTLESLPIPVQVDLATPWRRFWARWVDVVFGACLVGFVLGAVRPSLYQPGGWGAAHEQLLGWLVMPVVMVLDGVVYAVFGNTPGKAIAGIAVRDERSGGRLPLFIYLKRNFELYFFGLGTVFPILALIALVVSFRRADRDELLSWDLSADSRVMARSVNPLRTWIVALAYFMLVGGLSLLRYYEHHRLEQRQAANASNPSFAEKQLRDAAEEVNKDAPRMVDAQTRLDRAEVDFGMTFTYEYTLMNLHKLELGSARVEQFQREVRRRLRVSACEENKLAGLLQMASAVRFVYRDRDGLELATVAITRSDCLR